MEASRHSYPELRYKIDFSYTFIYNKIAELSWPRNFVFMRYYICSRYEVVALTLSC